MKVGGGVDCCQQGDGHGAGRRDGQDVDLEVKGNFGRAKRQF